MTVDIVIPTYNEQHTIERCVKGLLDHLETVPFQARITITDNASTDLTPVVAEQLAREHEIVNLVHVPRKGRGIALKTAWLESDADVLVYMDVDLSTNLNALLPLVAPLLSGHSDLAIGTRLAAGSRVLRGSKRELVSRGYNLLVKVSLGARFGDAQCGFKAIRGETARWLLPLVRDDSWFFDTELLVLAERAGPRIHQVPVDWIDDPDSRVDIIQTAKDDLKGIARLGTSLALGRVPLMNGRPPGPEGEVPLPTQVLRFAAVGLVSTVGYAVLFLLLRTPAGVFAANLVALVAMTILNTSVNRMWTFGVRGRRRAVTHQLLGMLVLIAGLAATTLALVFAAAAGVTSPTGQFVVLTATNVLVTLGRFTALRLWVFHARGGPAPGAASEPVALAQDHQHNHEEERDDALHQ